MTKKVFSSIVLSILLIVACNTQSSQQPVPTPIFIPVIVTVGIPVPVTVTPRDEVFAAQVSSDNTSLTQTEELENLEEDSQLWGVFEEGSPTWILQNADSPAQNGKSLQCSITGGASYSNAHCYINLTPIQGVNSFSLNLDFHFSPETTCNNQESPSIVQAIEFSMSKWENSERYEFAIQWQNVGNGAPQWRYWDPSRIDAERWVPISVNTSHCLESDLWHTLALEGDIVDDQVHYKNFTIDNFTYNLDLMVPPVPAPNEVDRLAVAVQADGNEQTTPYDLFIDNVNFTVQKQEQVNCGEINAKGEAALNFQILDTFRTTQGREGFVINRDTKIAWKPACLMDLQYYLNGDVIFEKRDAASGQYDSSQEIPLGEEIEIKIWRAGKVIDSLWVRVRE